MKRKTVSELWAHSKEYVLPEIAIIELASEQILCESNWNDGSIDDDEDNWNIYPML